MPEVPRDLPHDLDLLRRLGEVCVNGIPAHSLPLLGRYSFWQRYSQSIFSTDIKSFSIGREECSPSLFALFRGALLALLGLVVSYAALVSVWLGRPEVVLFGIDRVSDRRHQADFRTSALYDYLVARGVRYQECFHTVFDRAFLANLFSRGRLPLYLETTDIFGGFSLVAPPIFSNLGHLSTEEARFARSILTKYLRQAEALPARLRFLRRFLRLARPKAVWMIDDARHYQDLALASRLEGIPTYAFQHGHFTKYHVGWLVDPSTSLEAIRPDFLIVANEYWRRELARLGSVFPPESIIVGGPLRASTVSLPPPAPHEGTLVLIPHETDSPKRAVAEVIARLASSPGISLVFKLRPDYPRDAQLAEYPGIPQERITVVTSLAELSSRPDVCVGVYSTFLYEMVEAGVPVGILGELSDYGIGMVENGLAELVATDERLIERVQTLAYTPKEEVAARREKFVGKPVSFTATLDSIRMSS